VKIKLTGDQLDLVIVTDLKRVIGYLLDPREDTHGLQADKDENLRNMLGALSYYSKPSEYETFVRKNGL
jgi:hypothetical protein